MEVQGAVMAVHRALEARRIPHLIFGRYAVELALCEEPDGVDLPSPVVAILVDGNQRHVINIIITSSPLFTYSEADGLRYIPDLGYISADPIFIEIFESVREPYCLPSARLSTRLLCPINPINEIAVLHPAVHVIAAARIWNFCSHQWLVEVYLTHVRRMLRWLATRGMHIDFEGYRGLRKPFMLKTFSTLYRLRGEVRELLQTVMKPEDFRAIRDNDIPL